MPDPVLATSTSRVRIIGHQHGELRKKTSPLFPSYLAQPRDHALLRDVPECSGPLFAILAYQDHWVTLACYPQPGGFHAILFDGIPGRGLQGGVHLARAIATAWNTSHLFITATPIYHQAEPFTCGTIALAHVAATSLIPTFTFSIGTGYLNPALVDDTIIEQLVPLLISKGVPDDRAHNTTSTQQAEHQGS